MADASNTPSEEKSVHIPIQFRNVSPPQPDTLANQGHRTIFVPRRSERYKTFGSDIDIEGKRFGSMEWSTISQMVEELEIHTRLTLFRPFLENEDNMYFEQHALYPKSVHSITFWHWLFRNEFERTLFDPEFTKTTTKVNFFRRENWSSRRSYMLSSMSYIINICNLWLIHARLEQNGGLVFILVYLLVVIVFGMPILSLQLGYGQFMGRGIFSLYRLFPLFSGLGWVKLLIISNCLSQFGVISAWAYFYLVSTMLPQLPWSRCDFNYNSKTCTTGFSQLVNSSRSPRDLATFQYWEYMVLGIRDEWGKASQLSAATMLPSWHLSLCLAANWVVISVPVMYGIKQTWRVLRVTSLFPLLASIVLFSVGISTPGSGSGLRYMLRWDFSWAALPRCFGEALFQLICSMSLSETGHICLSSLNGFRTNFYLNAMMLLTVDVLVFLWSSMNIFVFLGHMAHVTNTAVRDSLLEGPYVIFVSFLSTLSSQTHDHLLTILLNVSVVMLAFNKQSVGLEIITIELMDFLKRDKKIDYLKPIITAVCCCLMFVLGLIYTTLPGLLLLKLVSFHVNTLLLPSVLVIDLVMLAWFYGVHNIRRDFMLMSRTDLGILPYYVLAAAPLFIVSYIFGRLFLIQPLTFLDNDTSPPWLHCLGLFVVCLFLAPFQVGFFIQLIRLRNSNRHLDLFDFLKLALSPSPVWGPRFKLYFLFDNYYKLRLFDLIVKRFNPGFSVTRKQLDGYVCQYIKEDLRGQLRPSVILKSQIDNTSFASNFDANINRYRNDSHGH